VSSGSYTDPGQHLFWLASRAAGVVALILVALSVLLGLAMAGRVSRRPGLPARLKVYHEALALSGLVAIATHGLLLLGDSYLRPGLAGIAVPFLIVAKPLWTGLGIIGGWLAAILGLSFYVRRWIGTRTWRWMHRWTLLVYLLAVAHTIGSGTDARSPWLAAIVGATAVPIVFLATYRFLPASRRPATAARGHAPARSGDQPLPKRAASSEPPVASPAL
jgi:sulfoxide reductase heme-binding subunit YedZ